MFVSCHKICRMCRVESAQTPKTERLKALEVFGVRSIFAVEKRAPIFVRFENSVLNNKNRKFSFKFVACFIQNFFIRATLRMTQAAANYFQSEEVGKLSLRRLLNELTKRSAGCPLQSFLSVELTDMFAVLTRSLFERFNGKLKIFSFVLCPKNSCFDGESVRITQPKSGSLLCLCPVTKYVECVVWSPLRRQKLSV